MNTESIEREIGIAASMRKGLTMPSPDMMNLMYERMSDDASALHEALKNHDWE